MNKQEKIEFIKTRIEKKCSGCKLVLHVSLFGKNIVKLDGLTSYCKKCLKERREQNKKQENVRRMKIYYSSHEKNKAEKRANKEQNNIYAAKHRERYPNQAKEYYLKNKAELNEKTRIYQLNKMHTDPSFKCRKNVSNQITAYLKRSGNSKNGSKTFDNLPYSPKEFVKHIELLFEPWMNWGNHGIYNPVTWDDNDESTWTWQIDHIIPHSKFPYASLEDPLFKECWALSNLRPLSAKQNVYESRRK